MSKKCSWIFFSSEFLNTSRPRYGTDRMEMVFPLLWSATSHCRNIYALIWYNVFQQMFQSHFIFFFSAMNMHLLFQLIETVQKSKTQLQRVPAGGRCRSLIRIMQKRCLNATSPSVRWRCRLPRAPPMGRIFHWNLSRYNYTDAEDLKKVILRLLWKHKCEWKRHQNCRYSNVRRLKLCTVKWHFNKLE